MNGYYPNPWLLTFYPGGVYEYANFGVLVPTTQARMEQGLQGFPALQDGEGMLFLSRALPDEEVIPMWMGKVVAPLDMVWLGNDERVRHVERNVQVGDRSTYEHRGLAVAELKGGTCDRAGIRSGTRWSIDPRGATMSSG